MKQPRRRILLVLCVLCVSAVNVLGQSRAYLLHLPGIGGHMPIDDLMTQGLAQGKLDAEIEIYDWTGQNPGLAALVNLERNEAEAKLIAEKITKQVRANPKRRFILTSHSGGGGMAVFALEKLPDDVQIDTLLMLANALSPQYDLTKALRHVKGKVYVFVSDIDPVLGAGTRNFGTMDRQKSDSAGRVGFTRPEGADPLQYDKLVTFPYDAAWMRLGNAGDHVGTMNRPFARVVIATLLKTGRLPVIVPATGPSPRPTTLPATSRP